MPKFDWFLIVSAAVVSVGVMEYVKGFVTVKAGAKPVPSWVWRLVLLVICAGVAAAMDGGLSQAMTNALALVAVAEVGYPVLIQLPKAAIDVFRKKLEGGA